MLTQAQAQAQEQIHCGLEAILLVHEFSCSDESRQRPKQQVLREGFHLATALGGSFVTRSSGQPIDFGRIEGDKRGAINLSMSW
jgi:hypothetical protein